MKIEAFDKYKERPNFIDQLMKFARSVSNRPCDKCKQPVPTSNSALVFEFINSLGTNWTIMFAENRHLEPVSDHNNVIVCEGSPSRWQKIKGIPDSRPEYKINKLNTEDQAIADAIWQIMQELGNKELK